MRYFGLLLLSCTAESGAEKETAAESALPPGCGDGVLDADEVCDEGLSNSDVLADACRTSCFPASCGDAVVDAGEACDDGAGLGGDGCSSACFVETGTPDLEPNDEWDVATPAVMTDGAGEVNGSLADRDVDCWSVEVPACGAVAVTERAPCGPALTLALHAPDGSLVASGAPGDDGCAKLDPLTAPGARWVAGGLWSVCVSAVNKSDVPDYVLEITTPDPTAIGAPSSGADTDADSVPDTCDTDIDGDGLDNDLDNCPDVSNGPLTPAPTLSSSGYIRHWLSAGPFTDGVTTAECRPSEEALVGEDGELAPSVADPAGDLVWTYALLSSDTYDFTVPYGWATPSRESYTVVYLQSASARDLTLSLGADDGVFAWWNGVQVLDVGSCQGVNADQFQAAVSVSVGWNTLLVKVRDWGGGWGQAVRFLDAGVAVTDLVPSLSPDGAWTADQGDHDGDGIGDVCDAEP